MQGVGTVFQFTGVILFVASMFICCGSSLLSKDTATHTNLTSIGWHFGSTAPTYSAQRATTISLMGAICFGIALAAIGLGLQAQNRIAPWLAAVVTAIATIFWSVHAIFFAQAMHSIWLTALCAALGIGFLALYLLAMGALKEFLRNPPPRGFEILPADYKVPYSHMHQDPPEVRMAQELDQRRQRLAVQQKELQMLEERLRRKIQEHDKPAE
jgi:hypothetical protein